MRGSEQFRVSALSLAQLLDPNVLHDSTVGLVGWIRTVLNVLRGFELVQWRVSARETVRANDLDWDEDEAFV